ncbi:MAG: Ig-like domain-containing protein [Methanomassiliicoccales archaeon]
MKTRLRSTMAFVMVAMLAMAFAVPATVLAAPEPGDDAIFDELGEYGLWINTDLYPVNPMDPGYKIWAGYLVIYNVDKDESYNAYCLDYNKPLNYDDAMVIDDLLTAEEWCKVNWVLNNYQAEGAADPNLEAAAIQAVIWMITYNDDDLGISLANVSMRAAEIYGTIPANCAFPASLELSPACQSVGVGEAATITATVLDNNGNPMPGVEVAFHVHGCCDYDEFVTTDCNGEASIEVMCCHEGMMITVTAEVKGGYGRLVEHVLETGQDVVLLPGMLSDIACVRCCYYPDGYTMGFWKTNIGKLWGYDKGKGTQVTKDQVLYALAWIDDLTKKHVIPAFGSSYNGALDWLKDLTPKKAYDILNYEKPTTPMKMAKAQMLAMLLTAGLYEQTKGEGYYLNGCVDMPEGMEDISIHEAMHWIVTWYHEGKYSKAASLADYINNQPEGGY